MKKSVMYEQGKFRCEDYNIAPCKEHEIKVKVGYCGICGSDIHKVHGTWKYGFPATLGHEFSGEVVALGSDVTNFKIGDKIVCIPFIPCNDCHSCKKGQFSMCDNYKMIGTDSMGGFSQYVNIPESNAINIGDLDLRKASFIEPLAVVMHSALGLNIQVGDSVVILGAGTIGMLTMQVVKSIGAEKVIVVDIDEKKLKLAKKLGASHLINAKEQNVEDEVYKITNSFGADFVFECAGSSITQEQALLLAKKGGKIAYLGIAYKDILLKERAFESIFRRELTLRGFWNSYSAPFPGKEWQTSLQLIKTNKVDVESLISHEFSLDEVNEAFQTIAEKKQYVGKVLIKPNEEGVLC